MELYYTMANTSNEYMRYFLYSLTQAEQRRKIDKGMSAARTIFPKVRVNGIYREYTEMVKNPSDSHYNDARVIAAIDIREAQIKDAE